MNIDSLKDNFDYERSSGSFTPKNNGYISKNGTLAVRGIIKTEMPVERAVWLIEKGTFGRKIWFKDDNPNNTHISNLCLRRGKKKIKRGRTIKVLPEYLSLNNDIDNSTANVLIVSHTNNTLVVRIDDMDMELTRMNNTSPYKCIIAGIEFSCSND
jgi:hypothetical protein